MSAKVYDWEFKETGMSLPITFYPLDQVWFFVLFDCEAALTPKWFELGNNPSCVCAWEFSIWRCHVNVFTSLEILLANRILSSALGIKPGSLTQRWFKPCSFVILKEIHCSIMQFCLQLEDQHWIQNPSDKLPAQVVGVGLLFVYNSL